ncbi:hypothetical protein IG631_13972 [Alternaria alternata]|nr:hypothetical protein IG631_13972 [Alternaria alternata]
MHTNYAPPPPPPPHYPPSLPTYYSDRQTYVNAAPPPPPHYPPPLPTYYSDRQTYVNAAPPPPTPPPPPPPRNFNPSTTSPQYHSSGPSYVPMPSRSLESGYAPRDPRYVQALPSLQYGQLAYQSHLAPPSP